MKPKQTYPPAVLFLIFRQLRAEALQAESQELREALDDAADATMVAIHASFSPPLLLGFSWVPHGNGRITALVGNHEIAMPVGTPLSFTRFRRAVSDALGFSWEPPVTRAVWPTYVRDLANRTSPVHWTSGRLVHDDA